MTRRSLKVITTAPSLAVPVSHRCKRALLGTLKGLRNSVDREAFVCKSARLDLEIRCRAQGFLVRTFWTLIPNPDLQSRDAGWPSCDKVICFIGVCGDDVSSLAKHRFVSLVQSPARRHVAINVLQTWLHPGACMHTCGPKRHCPLLVGLRLRRGPRFLIPGRAGQTRDRLPQRRWNDRWRIAARDSG